MDMFVEIDKVRKDFPGFKTVTKEVSSVELNGYQKFAVIVYLICFCAGIIVGNLFPVCGSSSNFFSVCTINEFNFSLMLFIWFVSLPICLFFFAIGHIIALLTEINKKLGKKN
ncbi:MAG: hypothetical protein E7160_03470 [Firmicutes bacterium]|nr:hypothetical protein [Bacillota bacterium]